MRPCSLYITSPPCSPLSCPLCSCYPPPDLALIQHAGRPRLLRILFILFRHWYLMPGHLPLVCLHFSPCSIPMPADSTVLSPSSRFSGSSLHNRLILSGAILLGFYLPILSCTPKGSSDNLCLFYPILRDSLFIFFGSNTSSGATKALLPFTIVLPHIMILGLNYSGGTGKGLYHYFWEIFLLSLEVEMNNCFSSSTI